MDVLSAARLEFALTAAVHYAFVATTLGLTPVIAALSFFGLRSGRDGLINRLAATQLARLYLLNYAIGIVSGLVMELQLGLNWTGAGRRTTRSAAGITGGFWIAATGATLLLRHRTAVLLPIDEAPVEVLLGRRLLRIAVPMVALAAPLTLAFGVLQFSVARTPGFTPAPSFFGAFLALMMFGGFGIWVVTWLLTLPLLAFRRLHRTRWLLRLMVAFAPFPLVFNVAGWVYREENRQPWFIVNRVLVPDALSATSASGVLITGTAFLLIGVTAALVTWRLMYRAMASPPTERLGVRLNAHDADHPDDSDDLDDLLELAR